MPRVQSHIRKGKQRFNYCARSLPYLKQLIRKYSQRARKKEPIAIAHIHTVGFMWLLVTTACHTDAEGTTAPAVTPGCTANLAMLGTAQLLLHTDTQPCVL